MRHLLREHGVAKAWPQRGWREDVIHGL